MHRKLTGNVASDHRFRLPETQKPLSTDYVAGSRKPPYTNFVRLKPQNTSVRDSANTTALHTEQILRQTYVSHLRTKLNSHVFKIT